MKTAWLAQRPFLSEGLTQHDLLLSILIALSLLFFFILFPSLCLAFRDI